MADQLPQAAVTGPASSLQSDTPQAEDTQTTLQHPRTTRTGRNQAYMLTKAKARKRRRRTRRGRAHHTTCDEELAAGMRKVAMIAAARAMLLAWLVHMLLQDT